MVKFMWNGIKVDGKLYKAWFSTSDLINYPKGTITIYAWNAYPGLPKIDGLNIENNTDTMTDYFDKDKIRVLPGNTHYPAITEAIKKQKEHSKKMSIKRGF